MNAPASLVITTALVLTTSTANAAVAIDTDRDDVRVDAGHGFVRATTAVPLPLSASIFAPAFCALRWRARSRPYSARCLRLAHRIHTGSAGCGISGGIAALTRATSSPWRRTPVFANTLFTTDRTVS